MAVIPTNTTLPPIPPASIHYYLSANDSQLLKKSLSSSVASTSLLPRPIKSTSSGIPSRHRSPTINNSSSESTLKSVRKQRATLTPRMSNNERNRTYHTVAVPKLPSTNWISGIFSSTLSASSSSNLRSKIRSVIRLSTEKGCINNREWQLVKECTNTVSIRYIAPKTSRKFEFDYLYRENTMNKDIYDESVKPIIEEVCHGYNGTVFGYGQPRTGKSYTMMGTQDDPGMIPLAMDTVFDTITRGSPDHEYLVLLSYFEINNEIIRDLLVEPSYEKPVELKISDDNKRRGPYIPSLKEEIVTSSKQAMDLIKQGEANRYILTHSYTSHHSRSHTLLQLTIERRIRSLHNDSTPSIKSNSSNNSTTTHMTRKTKTPKHKPSLYVSYLSMIDLASNDKSIYQIHKNALNKSCFALESIVHNLSEAGKSPGHPSPPYHDSKLTRLLQPMFTGHHNGLSICTVDMEASSRDEIPTLDTFNFAARIRKIGVSPKLTELSEEKSTLVKIKKNLVLLHSKLEKMNEQSENGNIGELRNVIGQKIHERTSYILSSKSSQLFNNQREVEEYRHDLDDNKCIPDRIAQLEAELHITKAELQVAQLMVSESIDSSPLRLAQ